MCGQVDFDLSSLPAAFHDSPLRLDARLEFDRLYRDFDDYVIISGRRWGKSRSPSDLRWPFDEPPDDRPITEILDEHFRARFERSERAPHVFQDLYDVPGAL